MTNMDRFNSLPTVEQVNLVNYTNVLMTIDPQLYAIHLELLDTMVNPILIPKIIQAIAGIAMGTRYGKVQIFIEDGVVSQIKGEESRLMNELALIDRN